MKVTDKIGKKGNYKSEATAPDGKLDSTGEQKQKWQKMETTTSS